MTEQTPIHQGSAEQRLVEELTGPTPAPTVPEPGEPREAGDPEPEDSTNHPDA